MPFDTAGFKQDIALLDVLLEGRRRIAESWFGFDPKHEGVPPGGHCAVFAITRQSVGVLTLPALGCVARAIYGSDDPSGIQPWNDTPGRTQEEVLAAYDAAIALSRSAYP